MKVYLENYKANCQVRSAQALSAIGGEEARKALETAVSRKSVREDVKADFEVCEVS